ncbi:CD209 antigen-like protein C [Sceloporus undulatus]|uniref:CD209 antigen-like protein C n=1 Tax=Sceloporus undulatus TaxID=8520 RepID=UPI001C4B1433|nr:CD209 antigen-like protein C [Sceloporus undulatus]
MWAGLLSLVLIKFSSVSEELQALNLNYSEMLMRVWQDLDNIQEAQKIMERTVSNNFSELQDITASICGEGKSLVSRSCPTIWKMEGRNCYYFSAEKKNWTNALWHCINKKANLVSVWSDEEQEFLRDNLNNVTHWLGMTDIEREGKWKWKEGNLLVSTTFWDKGEPQMSHEKNCGIIQPNGTWASAVCSFHHHWICKKKADLLKSMSWISS